MHIKRIQINNKHRNTSKTYIHTYIKIQIYNIHIKFHIILKNIYLYA